MTTNTVVFGTVGGVAIQGDVPAGTYGLDALRTVTLGATAYVRSPPFDWPRADAGANPSTSLLATSQTIPAGTVLTVFAAEADALVAAAAAN